jgi:isopenicillin-N N-acyltransferase-like protein
VPFAGDICVLLEAHRDNKPGYATIVEAGMLAKVGFNAAGLGVCTNTLVSTLDTARRGVPYHVMLRALLDAESMADATSTLFGAERALSANYLVAHKSGTAANFETTAGDSGNIRTAMPERGLLAHANHFIADDFAALDFYVGQHPHSLSRLAAMRRGLREARPRPSVARLKEILRDHDGAPNGICSHPDPQAHPLKGRATIASVIADLTQGEVWLTAGPPCASEYQKYSIRSVFDAAIA